ncbi:hypothetical protein DD237_002992 [Peronospora effusa]|uniref:B box-type domain-containing protein n=1 Tax=Peronospora effusa TaxID=542832 RepID=A0A425CGU9_9STRA|nr:hypothetical protein DD237_002992 [Peronospora effusa]
MASSDAPLVSPPPQMIEEIFVSDLCATPFKLSTPTSQKASQSTPNTTFKESLSETFENEPPIVKFQKFQDKFQLNLWKRLENDKRTTGTGNKTDEIESVETIDTKEKNRRKSVEKDKKEDKNMGKMWFDVLPVVLENIKTYNREHVRQLSLPRCIKCERVREEQKAVIRCKQKDCIVLDRPLCLLCWELYHQSLEARQHRGQHTSACPQCQLDWAVYWCAECDLKFCKKCFEEIHSVSATTSHRKIATEDAPGTCFVTSHWSASFQNVIVHMIASRKQKTNSKNTGGSTIGAKRKRDIEVIVIDDEDDEKEVSQQNGSSTGKENGFMRSCNADSQPQQNASDNSNYQASTNEQSMLVLMPSKPLAPLSQQTSSACSTSSTSNDAKAVNIGTGVESLQWDGASSQMRDSSTTASATSVTGNGMMQVTQSSMSTAANTTSGSWSTSTNVASTSHSNGQLPLRGAFSAENALSDSLMDHYHKVNQVVAKMELQSEQLNRQLAITTYQGPYRAGPVMALLMKLQPVLEAAKKRRDQLLVATIVQSKDIMASVRLLRLAELGDVPKIFSMGHRTCLQLTNEIDRHEKSSSKLYQRFSEALSHSAPINSSWEDLHIRAVSANIQMHERNIKKLKRAREVEFVRIVQFSHNIREALKQALKQALQRQQLQRHQSQIQPSE